MVVNAALQEDVDVIGLSILSGAHIGLVTAILDLMKKQKLNKPIFVGNYTGSDVATLKKAGVSAVFGPGAKISEIVELIHQAENP